METFSVNKDIFN